MSEHPIVCATDLKKSGAIAAAWAAYFAERLGTSVKLVHAKGEPDPELQADVPPMMRDVAKVYNERITEERVTLRHTMEDQERALRERGLEVSSHMIEGRAADALESEIAEPVSLVVAGPHTRLFDEEVVERHWVPFGTTAERVAHAGKAPVFVARTEAPVAERPLRLLFDLESAEDAAELAEAAKALAERLGARFVVVDHESDLRAMAEDALTTDVLVTAATRDRADFLLAAPVTRRLRRFPFPVIALPRGR